jgi:hypothetical protein
MTPFSSTSSSSPSLQTLKITHVRNTIGTNVKLYYSEIFEAVAFLSLELVNPQDWDFTLMLTIL